MSMIDITIPFDEEKLKASEFTLKKENTTTQQRLERTLIELYEKAVPEALREYVDSKTAPATPKPKRPAKQPTPKPQPAPAKPTVSAVAPMKEAEKNG